MRKICFTLKCLVTSRIFKNILSFEWGMSKRWNDAGPNKGHTKSYKRIFAVIFNVSKYSIQSNTFDPDSSTAIVDNSANTQICNYESMFVGKLHEVNISGVATIGGTDFKPTVIVTVKWSCKDDEGKSHTHRLERGLYFSESPVKIISSTALADQYDDDYVTYIKTKNHSSEFSWNFGQYTRTITHSPNCLAKIPINDGYEFLGVLLKRMKYQKNPRIYFCNCSYMNQTDLPEDSQFPRVDFRANILPNDD